MQGRTLAIAAIFLTGCAATPEPVLNGTPVEISQDELDEYWVARQSGVFVRTPTTGAGCGVVDIRFLIDSNGEVHDVEVLDAQPKYTFDDAAVAMQEAFSYAPSDRNPGRTPVRVTRFVTFDMGPTDDVDCADVVQRLKSARQD
jgi:TonB family protein